MHACKSCEEVKPATEFRVHKRGYRIGSCKPCERAYQRELTDAEFAKLCADVMAWIGQRIAMVEALT